MPIPNHDFHAEGDEDLLTWMAMRENEPEYAKAAGTEFFQRYLNYVYAVVRLGWGGVLDENTIDDLVMRTFSRVYEKADTYTPSGGASPQGRRPNVLGWVSAIAKHIVADHFRDENTRLELIDDWGPVETRIIPREYGAMSADARLAGEALEALPRREHAVVLATIEHLNVGAANQRLPNGVVQGLARTFHTTPENIRQIRKRALAKIRKHVENGRAQISVGSQA